MKILVYLWSYPPHRFTGGELMTADLLEYLVGQGHDVSVYAHEVKERYERNGVQIIPKGYLGHHVSREYDVFITHPEIRTGVWSEVRDMPYIGIVHNTNPGTLRSIERHAPHLTIANSHYTRHQIPLVGHNTGMGVHVIHPPVLIEPKKGTAEFVTAVNISLEKGGDVLNYIAHQNKGTRFLAVLGGHGLQVTNQPTNVQLNKPTNDMQSVYADTRVLLFPTHHDTYGKVVAEAMQFGIPVLASDVGGVPEVADDCAMLLDPHQYEAWSVALQSLDDPKVYAEWSKKSKQRGTTLKQRSLDDLERWGTLVTEVAQFDERRNR